MSSLCVFVVVRDVTLGGWRGTGRLYNCYIDDPVFIPAPGDFFAIGTGDDEEVFKIESRILLQNGNANLFLPDILWVSNRSKAVGRSGVNSFDPLTDCDSNELVWYKDSRGSVYKFLLDNGFTEWVGED